MYLGENYTPLHTNQGETQTLISDCEPPVSCADWESTTEWTSCLNSVLSKHTHTHHCEICKIAWTFIKWGEKKLHPTAAELIHFKTQTKLTKCLDPNSSALHPILKSHYRQNAMLSLAPNVRLLLVKHAEVVRSSLVDCDIIISRSCLGLWVHRWCRLWGLHYICSMMNNWKIRLKRILKNLPHNHPSMVVN